MQGIKSVFFSFFRLSALLFFLLPLLSLTAADRLFCSQCHRQIRPGQRYIKTNDKVFCSRRCYVQTLPECTVCGKRSSRGGIYAADHSFFACPDCMNLPRCFACQIPVRNGNALSCGRVICRNCSRTAVSDPVRARALFDEVRRTVHSALGIATGHPIEFSLTDPAALHRLSNAKSGTMVEQGLFLYNAEVEQVVTRNFLGKKIRESVRRKNEKFRIFVLDFLPEDRMEYVIAHELAHDWMAVHYPGIREEWIREGFAEYIAWRYNQHKKRKPLNRRIEINTDPVYGEGFRRIREIAEKRGFQGLMNFLESKCKRNQNQTR